MPHHGNHAFERDELVEYLTTHVYRDGDCLLWAGTTTGDGYPQLMWQRRIYRARRLLISLTEAPLRANQCIWSKCGSKACMQRAHLVVGTRAAMVKHMAREGRTVRGAQRSIVVAMGRAPRARLGIARAQEVLRLRADGWTLAQIGERYGVTLSAVGHAIQRWQAAGVMLWDVREAA